MMDNDALREERDRLLDENTKMQVKGSSSARGDDSSTIRYLKSKVSSSSIVLAHIKRISSIGIPL